MRTNAFVVTAEHIDDVVRRRYQMFLEVGADAEALRTSIERFEDWLRKNTFAMQTSFLPQTRLVEAADDDFAWMLGDVGLARGLRLPDNGVEDPNVLGFLRKMTAKLREQGCNASWMMVSGDEVVGLCSYLRPPLDGEVEVGYGVAASRRNRGHATRAVTRILEVAARQGLAAVVAETAMYNTPSAKVLRLNGFVPTLRRVTVEDGEVQRWRRVL